MKHRCALRLHQKIYIQRQIGILFGTNVFLKQITIFQENYRPKTETVW